MTDQGITTAWFALGLGVAYLSLNILAATQQWPLGFALPSIVSFKDESRAAIATKAFYGVVLVAPALLLLLLLTAIHARRHSATAWPTRIPVSSVLGVMPESRLGRAVQCAVLLVFIVWPAYAVGHFLLKFFQTPAVCSEPENLRVEGWAHLWPGVPTGCAGRFEVEGRLVYEPFLTPWLLGAGGLGVALGTVLTLWFVARPAIERGKRVGT